MRWLAELLFEILPEAILSLFDKSDEDKTKHGEARFDSVTGKQIKDD